MTIPVGWSSNSEIRMDGWMGQIKDGVSIYSVHCCKTLMSIYFIRSPCRRRTPIHWSLKLSFVIILLLNPICCFCCWWRRRLLIYIFSIFEGFMLHSSSSSHYQRFRALAWNRSRSSQWMIGFICLPLGGTIMNKPSLAGPRSFIRWRHWNENIQVLRACKRNSSPKKR